MIRKNQFTRASVLLIVAAATFGLSACTGTSDGEPGESATSTASPNQPDTAPPFVGVQGDVIPAEDIENDPALYGAVALTGCSSTESGWLATGTATNSGSAEQKFHIIVNITDAQARAITSVVVDVDAAAGETATWEAPATIDAPADSTCVVAGVSAG